LVIDDIREFTFPAVYARTNFEAEVWLFKQSWDEVWWDWDLGWDGDYVTDTIKPTLLQVERRIAFEEPPPLGLQFIHSYNPVGRQTLDKVLSKAYNVVHVDPQAFLVAGGLHKPL
jgi:hypothetical protein